MQVIGFAGWSGAGKTTLIERLIPRLVGAGRRVALLKHAHHDFDVDTPGKDSWRARSAGALEVLVASSRRWALVHELRGQLEPTLDEHLARLADPDLVIVEGWKRAPITKIEIHRAVLGKPLLHPTDPHIVAIATDDPIDSALPRLPLRRPDRIAEFILALHASRHATDAQTP
jgi:molybdopterin-guanine dinucleotide biosynthesis protein B